MYNCVGGTIFGSYLEVLIGLIHDVSTGWEERTPVGLIHGGPTTSSLGNCNFVEGSI